MDLISQCLHADLSERFAEVSVAVCMQDAERQVAFTGEQREQVRRYFHAHIGAAIETLRTAETALVN